MVSISSGSGSRQRITAGCLRFLLVEFLQVRLRVVYAILEDLDWESSGGFAQSFVAFSTTPQCKRELLCVWTVLQSAVATCSLTSLH